MARRLRFYEASNIDGHYLGAYAVVVAHDEIEALKVLLGQLETDGLKQTRPDEIRIAEIDSTQPNCRVVFNGDY